MKPHFQKLIWNKLRSTAEFDHNRLIQIAEILECSKSQTTKLAVQWISSFNDLLRGEDTIIDLARTVFNIDPTFLQLLIINYDNYSKSIYQFDYRDLNMHIMTFMNKQLDSLKSEINENLDVLKSKEFFFSKLVQFLELIPVLWFLKHWFLSKKLQNKLIVGFRVHNM